MRAVAAKPVAVLVVEDNEADAELTIEGLTAAATDVTLSTAKDGRDALEQLRAAAADEPDALPDVILLDLNLPRMGGLETLAELREEGPRLRRIPVIVLTTSRSQAEINRSYELGAAAVLNKPMRLSEHREMMRAIDVFWLQHVRLPRDPL